MSATNAKLYRVAGLCAAAAGLLFIIIQPIHPPDEVAHVGTATWQVVHALSLAMSVLGLVGITGLYLRQARETSAWGLVGYVLFAAFYVIAIGFQFTEEFILPAVAQESPALVESVLGIVSGAGGPIELPALQAVWLIVSAAYLLGAVLLGVAFYRAAIFPRRAAALLAIGAVASLLVAVLPHAFERYAAVPTGLALMWLGAALWSERRGTAPSAAGERRTSAFGVATAE